MDTMIEFQDCNIPMTADNLKPFEEFGEWILLKVLYMCNKKL